jgi:RNA polymerase sigma factor (TIGR02999 family)
LELPGPTEVTLILRRLSGDGKTTDARDDRERLLALIYGELREIARRLMSRERVEHTLQPTALVHEVYLKLVDRQAMRWNDRAHFLGIAARAMRQILIDHARQRAAAKRGQGWDRVTFDHQLALAAGDDFAILELHEALEKLGALDERAARVAEMRLFGGMTVREAAHVLEVSQRTVDDDWAMARAWLSREIQGGAG